MRLLIFFVTLLLISPVAGAANAEAANPPTVYVVSRAPGTTLEGIAVTPGGTMYVTSLATGGVFVGSVTDRRLRTLVPGGADGRSAAAGVHVDRFGRVFVAGMDPGTLYVYSPAGRLLMTRPTQTGAGLNDFVFTSDAIYATHSNLGIVWRAAIVGRHLGPLTPWLTPDRFAPAPGYLNGIVSVDGRYLLVADQDNNLTYRVDIARRTAAAITVSGADGLFSADGMLRYGHELYGVYNYGATVDTARYVVRHMRMSRDWTHATWIADSASVGSEETPTTLARDRGRFLWVNSQLGFAPGQPPYTVSQVPGLRAQ